MEWMAFLLNLTLLSLARNENKCLRTVVIYLKNANLSIPMLEKLNKKTRIQLRDRRNISFICNCSAPYC